MTLEARNISVALSGRPVLRDVLVTCREGRILGLVGANGAGKSTVLRALAGLLAADSGQVLLDGAPVGSLARREIGRRIAYLPQERIVHWPLAVEAVVALGRMPHRGPARAGGHDEAAVGYAMQAMDIADLHGRSANQLSGGELARVLMARALAQEAPVILADEPTAGLDPSHALGLFEVLARLAAEGRTVVVALHDLSLAARFCHDVVMLKQGQVVAAGQTGEVLVPGLLAEAFGVPMAVGRIGDLPAILPIAPGR